MKIDDVSAPPWKKKRSDTPSETVLLYDELEAVRENLDRIARKISHLYPEILRIDAARDAAIEDQEMDFGQGIKEPSKNIGGGVGNSPVLNVADIFSAWWQAHNDKPLRVADLAQPVKDTADPAGRGRQYLATVIRALDGTRAAGFVLVRSASVGKWEADRYALKRVSNE